MKIHQLSLFLENQPGQMIEPCRLLAGAGIDIRSLSLADTRQFGILRVIVSDWKTAAELLESEGYVVNVTEVVAIEVEDRPGGLAELMGLFENSGINIEYMYAFPFGRGDRAGGDFRQGTSSARRSDVSLTSPPSLKRLWRGALNPS